MSESMQSFTKGDLVRMVEPKWYGRVVLGIEEAIRKSFATDQVLRPVMTRNEIERRFRICIEGFCMLRRDVKWSIPRIIDDLPRLLRCKLDGMNYEPDEKRPGWLPDAPSMAAEIDGPDMADPVPDVEGAIETEELAEEIERTG